MFLQSYLALVRAQFTAFRRSKAALFWSVAFPLGFLFLFGGIMARGNARAATHMMPGLLTTMLISGSLFGIAMPMVLARETGVLRRFRVTPLSAPTMILAHGTTALIQNAITFCLVLIVARFAFKTEIAGSLGALAVVFLFSAFSMVPMGLLVGSAARDMRSAPPIVNLLFFPLMFLSGSAFPFALLPDGMKRFARFLPTTYIVECLQGVIVESLQGVIVRGEGLSLLVGPLAILTVLGLTGLALASMLFRWEGTEPISRRSLAVILGAFTRVHAGLRVIHPELAQEAWSDPDPLSDRERQVLRSAEEGRSSADIALALGLSEGTVRNYLSEAISKLGVTNRIEAARLARQKGWL